MSVACSEIQNISNDRITQLYKNEFKDAGLEVIGSRYSTCEDDPIFPYSSIEINCSYTEDLTILKAPSGLSFVAVYPDLRLVKFQLSWELREYVFDGFDKVYDT